MIRSWHLIDDPAARDLAEKLGAIPYVLDVRFQAPAHPDLAQTLGEDGLQYILVVDTPKGRRELWTTMPKSVWSDVTKHVLVVGQATPNVAAFARGDTAGLSTEFFITAGD